MSDTEFERLLADFLDGDLEPAERARLADQLARDPRAAKALEQSLHLESLLIAAHRSAPPVRAPHSPAKS